MPTSLRNENKTLEFVFDDDWQVWPWDELPDYLNGIENLDESKAVDFIGVYRGSEVFFIEVKDCRVDPISNRSRIGAPLAIEVGQKTRDTVAGVIGAHRRLSPSPWKSVTHILATPAAPLQVVLWLELIPTSAIVGRRSRWSQNATMLAADMQDALRKHLAWLGGRARVVSLGANTLPGVVVRNLAGAGMPPPSVASAIQ